MMVALVYCIFTLLYYHAGGTNDHHLNKDAHGDTYLYKEKIDWGRYPLTTVVMCGLIVFVAMPLIHMAFYFLFKLREIAVEWWHFINKL